MAEAEAEGSSERASEQSDRAEGDSVEPVDWEPIVHAGAQGSLSAVVGGVYMVGAMPITSYEEDLKYEYAQRQTYLIRGVNTEGLCVPGHCRCEAIAFGMVSSGQATWAQLLRLVDLLPRDSRMRWAQDASAALAHRPKRFSVGAFNYGNMAGILRHSRRYPWVGRALAGVVRTWCPHMFFSSCTMSLNATASPHRDSRNLRGSCNLSLPCSSFTGGQIFIEDETGLNRLSADGPCGHLISAQEAVQFEPHRVHATLPWSGTRLLLLAYHIGQHRSLQPDDVQYLHKQGFHLSQVQ